jgi:hypothetical protein
MAGALSDGLGLAGDVDDQDQVDADASLPFDQKVGISVGAAKRDPRFASYYSDAREDAVRRIDNDWLWAGAQRLALKMDSYTNNTCLVLAFELPKSKQVLLFPADAQAGNWLSWHEQKYHTKDGRELSASDLLAKTSLYKVGHHGSHNATLAGTLTDPHANLSWMATTPACAKEFTAMITAVNEWALTKNDPPWRHPLPSIKQALLRKTDGRVFQTDEDAPEQPATVSAGAWAAFTSRAVFDPLFFDYTIADA